jgi:glutathione synthase/RimK-type ligase-like ATP-grasp enzyme
VRGRDHLKPKVLIATTTNWIATARLVIALAEVGFHVEALCPPGHPLQKTTAISRSFDYRGLTPLRSFRSAIETSNPDLIVPGDDLATRHLHDLHRMANHRPEISSLRSLIERSIGSPESYRIVYERATLIAIARQEAIRVPRTEVISTHADLRLWVSQSGVPVVLKANGTSGGDGVRIARTVGEVHRAFQKLQAPPQLARAAKRAVMDHDHSMVRSSLLRRRNVVNAQEFVEGREATSAIVCRNGEVLANLHFEVLEKISSLGHATVLRTIRHQEMSCAAEKLARRLNLSGFYGFDFMLAAGTGDAYLVEINPRTTQVGHLNMGEGRWLPAALFAALTGKEPSSNSSVIENDTVALFPQEWMRDAASGYLRTAYHDAPIGEPRLVDACMRKAAKLKGRDWQSLVMVPPLATAKYEPSSEPLGREPLMAREMGSRYE